MTDHTIYSSVVHFSESLPTGNTDSFDATNPAHTLILKFARGNRADTLDINPYFYQSFNKDLSALDLRECIDHWNDYGKSENRVSTLVELIKQHPKSAELPNNFNIPSYLSQNPDIVGAYENAWEIVLHYLNHGITENRNTDPLYVDNDFVAQLYGDIFDSSNSREDALDVIRKHYNTKAETPVFLNKKELFFFYGLKDSSMSRLFNRDEYIQAVSSDGFVIDNEAKALLHFFENAFDLEEIKYFSEESKTPTTNSSENNTLGLAESIPDCRNTIFDKHYYQQQANTYTLDDIESHYQATGISMGYSPSPFLALGWYATKHPQISHEGADPLQHLLQSNGTSWNDPRPSFDSNWYERKYMDSATNVQHPLAHYIQQGCRNSNVPHPLFDSNWYRKTYLTGMENIDPYLHFIEDGWKTNDPNPFFSVKFYLSQKGSNPLPDPLSHYIEKGWKLGLEPHILFDTVYFLKNIGKRIDQVSTNPLQLYFEHPEDIDTHVLFNSEYYKKQIALTEKTPTGDTFKSAPDYLVRSYTGTADPHPFFNKAYYYRYSGDVKSAKIDALLHYLNAGGTENRAVHPLFDTAAYLANFKTTLNANPLSHYLKEGYKNGLPCRAPVAPSIQVQNLSQSRAVTELSRNALHEYAITDENLKIAKIGVFAHVFYPDLLEEVIQHTNNIPGQCVLYISTDSYSKKAVIEQFCTEHSDHSWVVRVFENRGRDIAPFIVGFKDALETIDFGVHIHTKKSKHYKNNFDAWRKYLYDGNLGTNDLVRNILGILSSKNIGAYMPDHYGPVVPLLQWGGNFKLAAALLNQIGEKLSEDTAMDFPSGSMFWFTGAAIKPLLDIGLTPEHFDPEAGQVDGTLAHAIERSFFYFVESANLEYCVGKVQDTTTVESTSPLGNRIFPNQNSKGELANYYPELTQFLARRSSVNKPRLNLLIPTIETSQGYAGVSSALDMFFEIHKNLKHEFDARLIATDIPVSNSYAPPPGYTLENDLMFDQQNQNISIDGTKRSSSPIMIRDNDIFVATAWWTTMNALHLTSQQDDLFGKRSRKFCYLIQDYECGFHAWSTKYALADSTYRHPESTIPIFNTEVLYDYFKDNNYYEHGFVFKPGINTEYKRNITRDTVKEKLVLLYARPHADRNCLSFIDAVVKRVTAEQPEFWRDWRFLAIGEDFEESALKASNRIEVAGRLTIKEYAEYSSRAALAISLMVSPHPSYPPLELAEAGVKVLTNNYSNKDISLWHDNLSSIDSFDLQRTSNLFTEMATEWQGAQQSGWQANPHIDWFFNGATNLEGLAKDIAIDVAKQTTPTTKDV